MTRRSEGEEAGVIRKALEIRSGFLYALRLVFMPVSVQDKQTKRKKEVRVRVCEREG